MILTSMIIGLAAAIAAGVVLLIVAVIKKGKKQMEQDRLEDEKWATRKKQGYR